MMFRCKKVNIADNPWLYSEKEKYGGVTLIVKRKTKSAKTPNSK